MGQGSVQHTTTHSAPACQDIGLTAGRANWYALYVRSRHEFTAYDDLRRKGIDAFLPSVKTMHQWKDRRKLIDHPLFPGYVFILVAPRPDVLLSVLKARGVVTILSQERGKPTPVAPDEIRALQLLIESGRDIDLYPGLQEGTHVRVKNGPLKNAEGFLSKKEKECLFLVNVSLLGRSVSVKLSAQDIEAL
jgi:transcription termination/antitermination protein NusG